MKKRWVLVCLVVFLSAGGALAAVIKSGAGDALFSSTFDDY